MKLFGYILISIGLALLVFVAFNYFKDKSKFVSPVPEEGGVKVIIITPAK